MSSTRDYTDSESEGEEGTPSRPLNPASSLSTPRGGSPSPLKPTDPLRIKIRPGLSHLAQSSRPASSSASPPPTESDAGGGGPASSPPKFKIKLAGMKHSLGSNAQYSSSDESDGAAAGGKSRKEPPAKKRRTSKKSSVSAGTKDDKPTGPQLPAQHRKSYNWLQPSAAGASHHGPPDREGRERHNSHVSLVDSERRGGTTSDDGSARGSAPPEGGSGKKKAARRRGPDAAPGPGKNWRKGLKKGDPIPWKDGTTFLGRSSPLATPSRGSVSREVSPDIDAMLLAAASTKRERDREEAEEEEEDELDADPEPEAEAEAETERESRPAAQASTSRARVRERDRDRPREPSPPFELADAAKLEFPVFAKPIVAPKIVLGPFPKVTQFFAPFDQKPFRKEKVRDWSYAEKAIPGIGGSSLKFKTWARGPTSELGVLLQAQREAEAAAKAAKRESKLANKDSEPPSDRPGLHHSLSTGSVSRAASVDGDNDSELGDGDDSGVPSARESPAPSPRRRGGGKKAERKPRKSKLAQEITLTEPEGSAPPSEAGDADTKDHPTAVEA